MLKSSDGKDGALASLRRQVAKWRKTHAPRAPFPGELWARAVELAAQHGVREVAQATGLDYGLLKKRSETRPASDTQALQPAPPNFVEWLAPLSELAPAGDSIGVCTMELESARGARLRLELKDLSTSGLATLLREFSA